MVEGRVQERATNRPVVTTSEERTWAALVHASTLLTLLIGLPTAGLSGLLFVFVPLVIYLSYRDRSRFIAFHAAQAFVLQVVATVGFFTSIIAGAVIVFVLGITIVLILVAIFVAALVILIWMVLPFAIGSFAIVGAIETSNGRDYHYPYIGQLVEQWLAEHDSKASPAV